MGKFRQFLTEYLPATHLFFSFPMITLVNINEFSPNLVCALILWRSALGLLIGKFHQFLTALSASNTSVSRFQGSNQ